VRVIDTSGSILKSPPLPPGEGWGEGKEPSESIEKTGRDSSHSHPRSLSRRTGEGRLWDGFKPVTGSLSVVSGGSDKNGKA